MNYFLLVEELDDPEKTTPIPTVVLHRRIRDYVSICADTNRITFDVAVNLLLNRGLATTLLANTTDNWKGSPDAQPTQKG